MKISKETLSVLKNFASINGNILIKQGSTLSTINAAKNVLATATVTDEFPIDFGVYDLNEFLGIVSLYNEPEIEFTSHFAKIKGGNASVKYFAADPSVLTIPEKTIKFPTSDVEFQLTSSELANVLKTASVLRAPDISVVGKNGELTIQVCDLKNATANSSEFEIGKTDVEFVANFKVENLRLMSLDYTVSISSKKISRFVSSDESITVYIALESTSTF